ncbi:flagellar basal body L-ring protein FlgH [Marinibacterium profundimaris]|uniref:Flagellar L-ring protein n=1 Tax=Marinibacterium profundimaris TaxID=1679460 RepID=A0A225NMV4_9RHOB|nr:flagellar basal body L-ring protein FlgH [Marinibacterium profundimaris]OWU75854.1 flagellar L-ring protein FlgH [Marinibacterium profundimaris]
MTWATGLLICALAGCDLDPTGKPNFTPVEDGDEQVAMRWPGLPMYAEPNRVVDGASLWSGSRQSLLGDRRASSRGDILTVVIEIDESAEISNDTARERSGSESLSVEGLFGLPQRINDGLPDGASLDDAVAIGSSGSSSGKGSVKRNEKLELRVAATVVNVLPNGVLEIEGTQQVRVNFELRELMVAGFVRPTDISRQNQITYDKIAAARISYGGRGQITQVQQPRYGQRALDYVLPF